MKMIHPDINTPIIEEKHCCCEWIIEAPELFTKYIQELLDQISGKEGNFVLSDNDRTLEFSKYVEIIIDPFSIDINNRKLINKLYGKLTQIAYEKENYLYTQKVLSNLQEYMIGLECESDYFLCNDSETDISSVFKILNVRFEDISDNLSKKIEQYIKTLGQLSDKKVIIFVNLSNYLSAEQLTALIKDILYNEVIILLIESHQQKNNLDDRKWLIIDKDGCEIC